ncbi:PIG-L deacetylase family protein [Chloroflexota bacterium]
MDWIYLSPHFDDVALSCGGLVWEQTQSGHQVSIWTVCAGNPPDSALSPFAASLHTRWKTESEVVNQRPLEDIESCSRLGATHRHLSIPDSIYRRSPTENLSPVEKQTVFLYTSEASLFGPLHTTEAGLIKSLTNELARTLSLQAQVVCPLALGDHVDHQLVKRATERLERPMLYYTDYPYVLESMDILEHMKHSGWSTIPHSISENGMIAWEEAVSTHTSQISTFWSDSTSMRTALRSFHQKMAGVVLWRSPQRKLS